MLGVTPLPATGFTGTYHREEAQVYSPQTVCILLWCPVIGVVLESLSVYLHIVDWEMKLQGRLLCCRAALQRRQRLAAAQCRKLGRWPVCSSTPV